MERAVTVGAEDDGALPKGWSVYVLLCGDGTYYVGITTDIARRLRQHGSGSASRYTRARRPVTLVGLARCADRSAASRLEARLKALPRQAKEAFVRDHPPPVAAANPRGGTAEATV